MTHWFASDLSSKLRGFALPAAVKAQIVALASHGGEEATKALPPGVNAQALHATIDTAFVSGMHVALIVAGIALVVGSAVAGLLMRSGVPAEEVVPSEAPGAAVAMAGTPAALGSGAPIPALVASGQATAAMMPETGGVAVPAALVVCRPTDEVA